MKLDKADRIAMTLTLCDPCVSDCIGFKIPLSDLDIGKNSDEMPDKIYDKYRRIPETFGCCFLCPRYEGFIIDRKFGPTIKCSYLNDYHCDPSCTNVRKMIEGSLEDKMDVYETTRNNILELLEKYQAQEDKLYAQAMREEFLVPFAQSLSAPNILVTGPFGEALIETLDEIGLVKNIVYVGDNEIVCDDIEDDYVFVDVDLRKFEYIFDLSNKMGITIRNMHIIFSLLEDINVC